VVAEVTGPFACLPAETVVDSAIDKASFNLSSEPCWFSASGTVASDSIASNERSAVLASGSSDGKLKRQSALFSDGDSLVLDFVDSDPRASVDMAAAGCGVGSRTAVDTVGGVNAKGKSATAVGLVTAGFGLVAGLAGAGLAGAGLAGAGLAGAGLAGAFAGCRMKRSCAWARTGSQQLVAKATPMKAVAIRFDRSMTFPAEYGLYVRLHSYLHSADAFGRKGADAVKLSQKLRRQMTVNRLGESNQSLRLI
jgi:hypothetical protein